MELQIKKLQLPVFPLILLFLLLVGNLFPPLHILCYFSAVIAVIVASPFINRGLLFRSVAGFYIVGILSAIIFAVFSLLGMRTTATTMSIGYSILAIIWFVLGYCWLKLRAPRIFFPRRELLALFIGLMFCLPFAYPFLHSGRATDALSFIAIGGDNVSHLELISSIWRNGVVVSKAADSQMSVIPNLVGYPVGWHSYVVSVGLLVKPSIVNSSRILTLYEIFVLSNVFAFFFLFSATVLRDRFQSKLFDLCSVLTTFCISLTLLVFVFGPSYLSGFSTELATYPLILLLIIAISMFWESRDKDYLWLGLCLLINVGIALYWLYVLPVTALTSFAVFAFKLASNRKEPSNLFVRRISRYIVITIAFLPFMLYQLIIQLFFSPQGSGINAKGQISNLNPYLIGIIAITCLLIIPFYKIKKEDRSFVKLALTYLGSATVFAIAVGLYQTLTIGAWQYYFLKSLPLIAILVAIIIAIYIVVYIKNILDVVPFWSYILLIIAVSGIVLITPNASRVWAFAGGNMLGINPYVADQIIDGLGKQENVIIIGSCKRSQDYVSTRFASILSNNNDPAQQKMYIAEVQGSKNIAGPIKQLISKNISDSPLRIILVDKQLSEAAKPLYSAKGVSVEYLIASQSKCRPDLQIR